MKIDMTDEEFSMLYSRLCDFFWRLDFPDTPKDGLLHTSDVCRERARAIVKIVGMDGIHREATRRHLERLGPEGVKNLMEYKNKNKNARGRRRDD